MKANLALLSFIPLFISLSGCLKESNNPSDISPNDWSSVPTLTGKYISDISVTNSAIFAVSKNDTLFRSTNVGASWIGMNVKNCSLISARDSLIIVTYPTIQLSRDGGESWTDITSGLIGKVSKLSVNCSAVLNNILFAGTEEDGIFLSADYGVTWTASNRGLESPIIRTMRVQGNSIYAGTSSAIVGGKLKAGGLFVSTNSGLQWTSTGLTSDTTDIICATITDNLIIVGGGEQGLFLSTNNGINWVAINLGLANQYVTSLAVSGNNIFAGTSSGGVFLTKDNGVSWSAFNSDLPRLDVFALAIYKNTIFAGTGGGLWERTLK